MKKKKSFICLALMVVVLVLGVGYAISSIDLKVNSDVSIKADDSNFDVEFTAASVDGTGNNATIGDKKIATLDVQSLTTVGDTVVATYTITNKSKAGISAKLSSPVVAYTEGGTANGYYEATANLDSTEAIVPDGTSLLTVTVKLVKAPLTDVTGKFTVSFKADPVAQTE